MKKVWKNYSLGEEIFSAVTHGVGAGLSVAALVTMIVRAALHSNGYGLASAIVFGVSLVLLYTMSTLYHALVPDKAKAVFRIFDHATIFVLIAGTYTPFLLVTLRPHDPVMSWVLFGILWGLTVIGVVFDSIMLDRFHKIEMCLFVLMGWCIILRSSVLMAHLPLAGTVLLFSGGVAYTAGIVFFVWKVRYMHSIWHLFVLAGSILQYFSVILYVL